MFPNSTPGCLLNYRDMAESVLGKDVYQDTDLIWALERTGEGF